MSNKIAYMLLTCSRERSRYETMASVIQNLKSHPNFNKFNSDLIAFDNASTHEDAKDLLHSTFKHVVDAQDNYGYWNALGWVVRNHASVLGKEYEYIYLIESDQIHYDWDGLDIAESYLDSHPEISSMRVREFSVADAHLFDKERQSSESKRWAWCTQRNPFTGARVSFEQTENPRVFLTNFTALPPSVNRTTMMKHAFDHLESLPHFTEKDFWKACYDYNPVVALLDGGVCHAKLGFSPDVVSSHFSTPETLKKSGYVKCGESPRINIGSVKVHAR